MNPWKEHIAQLKDLIETLSQSLKPYWEKEGRKEKHAQLQSIEKTISNLQKNNTSVPDELRDLKFKLLKELDTFKEAESVKTEIQDLFGSFVPKGKSMNQRIRKTKRKDPVKDQKPVSRITLKELIEAEILPTPLTIIKEYKGGTYKAVITQGGHIEFFINGRKELFNSPSAAAVAASNKSQNGWTWWSIDGQADDRTLDYYRRLFSTMSPK